MEDISTLVGEVDSALRAAGDAVKAAGARAYLKIDLEFLGVAAKPLREVARSFLAGHSDLDRTRLLELVNRLWEQPVFDLRAAAVALLERRVGELQPGDLELVESLLRRSHTWALVDWLCTKVAAPLVARDPERARVVLSRWSTDDDFWVRRASMLAQLPALRAGGGDFGFFATFAAGMLEEKEFFIRKAIGWVLRDTSKRRPGLAYSFLHRHIEQVSGLTLREGAKYLPEEQREELMRARLKVKG
jgi:3-methyladenine DNA glycosylase AlkD